MVFFLDVRTLVVRKVLVWIELRVSDVWQQHGSLGAQEKRTLLRELVSFNQRLNFFRWTLAAVVPGDLNRLLGCKWSARKNVAYERFDGPVPLVGPRSFRAHRRGRRQLERVKHGI